MINSEKTVQSPLKCLEKTIKCRSKSCERIVECTEPDFQSHCYAMTIHNTTTNEPEILYAGCWSGGNECSEPAKLLKSIEEKISYENQHDQSHLNMLRNYTLSEQILNPDIQGKCIGYAKRPDEQSYLAKNNQSFCCCSKMVCNKNLVFVDELNPFTVFAKKMNPIIHNLPAPNDNNDSNSFDWFISARDLTMVCMSGLVCLIIVTVIFGLFFCLKKNSKKRKNSPYFSSVYYSRANSLNDLGNSNLGNFNHELTLIQNNDSFHLNGNNLDPVHLALSDENNFPLPNNHIEDQTIAAPNVQILPNNDVVYQKKLIKKNQQAQLNLVDYSYDSKDDDQLINNELPNRIKSTDICPIEKIAQGQFSSVWRSRCRNDLENNDSPEYAIKIFTAHQKASWQNEKDIFNIICPSNDNILKFFGSDINEDKKSELPFMLSNEYWLITEYHPTGSLHDFLKRNLISWPQLVSLAYCFYEGLAFLHSENSSVQKSYAIAHRDLKSKNILVKKDGHTCCIGDFGLALKLESKNKLSSVEIRSKVGTKRYMSPELIEGAIAFTKETFLRIDVYASALVLWEIVSRGDFYDETCEYKMPFEDQVGTNPSLDEMKEIVVDKSLRPVIKTNWLKDTHMNTLSQTMDECWDIDLDARISAECAANRIRKIYKAIN